MWFITIDRFISYFLAINKAFKAVKRTSCMYNVEKVTIILIIYEMGLMKGWIFKNTSLDGLCTIIFNIKKCSCGEKQFLHYYKTQFIKLTFKSSI
jgi:hypothetical protein